MRLNVGIGAQVSVGLPGATAADSGRTASDGTVVYTHAARSASVAAQALPDGGAQLLVAIDGADAPSEYAFPVTLPAGVQLRTSGDGGYFAKFPGGKVLTIAAPWARDAAGKTVPTAYRLEGQTLIQTVAHAGFAYPVVADPTVSYSWWNMTIYFNKADTITMATGVGGVALIAALIPDVTVTKVIAAVAGALALLAGDALARGKCVKIVKYAYISLGTPQEYGGSEYGGYCR